MHVIKQLPTNSNTINNVSNVAISPSIKTSQTWTIASLPERQPEYHEKLQILKNISLAKKKNTRANTYVKFLILSATFLHQLHYQKHLGSFLWQLLCVVLIWDDCRQLAKKSFFVGKVVRFLLTENSNKTKQKQVFLEKFFLQTFCFSCPRSRVEEKKK